MWVVDLLESIIWLGVLAFGVILGVVVTGTRKD